MRRYLIHLLDPSCLALFHHDEGNSSSTGAGGCMIGMVDSDTSEKHQITPELIPDIEYQEPIWLYATHT